MTHSEVRERLGPYSEGDLPLPVRALVDAHLDGCAECAGELRALRRTIDLLHALAQPEPPAGLVEAVMRRLEVGDGAPGPRERMAAWLAPRLRPLWLAPAAALAGAALVFLALRSTAPVLRPPVEPPPAGPVVLHGPIGASAAPETPEPAAAAAQAAEPGLPAPDRSPLDAAARRAIASPRSFLDELDRLEPSARDAWLEPLARYAAERQLAGEVAQSLRGSGDPRGDAVARRFEQAASGDPR
jgi:anti-sigma factor RsiW